MHEGSAASRSRAHEAGILIHWPGKIVDVDHIDLLSVFSLEIFDGFNNTRMACNCNTKATAGKTVDKIESL